PVTSSALPGHLNDPVPRGHDGGSDVVHDIEPLVSLENPEDRMHSQPVFPDRIEPLHGFEGGDCREVPLVVVILSQDFSVTLLLHLEPSLEPLYGVRRSAQGVRTGARHVRGGGVFERSSDSPRGSRLVKRWEIDQEAQAIPLLRQRGNGALKLLYPVIDAVDL